jgi:hypothetical protein
LSSYTTLHYYYSPLPFTLNYYALLHCTID